MLCITHPAAFSSERNWIFQFVFSDILGVEFTTRASDVLETHLHANGRTLTIPDEFFSTHTDNWRRLFTSPSLPLKTWPHQTVADTPTPILFGTARLELRELNLSLGIDIFGTAFFMLSRYEEIVNQARDEHDRFPASASIAKQAGFLDRPIIDEYIEILWVNMQTLWPNLQRKQRRGATIVTCDVDHPYDTCANKLSATLRTAVSDVIKRRNPKLALRRACNFVWSQRGDYRHDPFNTFDWYMDACEKNEHRAAFYFIAGHSGGAIDGSYTLYEPHIQKLLRRISQRGHQIGVHGSYNSYLDAAQITRERQAMIKACEKAGVNARIVGNRQHYLRWNTFYTPDALDSAGYGYDTTGAFADSPGFRYGTAHIFSMWSWQRLKPLRLKQKPLILMESSVISKNYLGLGYGDSAQQTMLNLKEKALLYDGNFSFLWHNSHLTSPKDIALFKLLLENSLQNRE